MLRDQHAEDAKHAARIELRATHEARMPKEDEILTLKNGRPAYARAALAECTELRYLLQHHRQHFDVLLAMVRPDTMPPRSSDGAAFKESVKYLARHAYLEKDGAVRPLIRDVLASAYQLTPDGPVVTQPFRLTTEAERTLAQRAERQLEDWFANGMRGLFPDDDETSPSR